MIHKQKNSKLFLTEASSGSANYQSVGALAKPQLDSKIFLEESILRETNESTTLGHNTSGEMMTLISSPNLLLTLNTSISCNKADLSLPTLRAKHSSQFKSANHFFPASNLLKKSPSPNLPLLVEAKKYDKIIINRNEDYTTPYYLKQLKKLFSKHPHKPNKTLCYIDGIRKYVSESNAKRVVYLLEKEFQSLRDLRHEYSATQTAEENQQQFNEQHNLIEKLDSAVTDIYEAVEKVLENAPKKKNLEAFFRQIIDLALNANNAELLLYCVYTQGKVSMVRNDFQEAISYFKNYKRLCFSRRVFDNRIFAFRNLGKCYQSLQKYKTALSYFKKFLQMAWHLESNKYELLAYDLIGKQYFYLGQVNKASAFHNKMTTGKLEAEGSGLKQIGLYKINMAKEPSYQMSRQQKGMSVIRKTNLAEDESDSSIDEAIDLPTPPPEEAESEREAQNQNNALNNAGQKQKQLLNKKIISKKNIERFFMGLKRVELIKNKEERNARFEHLTKKASLDTGLAKNIETESSKKFALKEMGSNLLSCKPSDQILVAHLSRNRNLKNFSTLPNSLNIYTQPTDEDLMVSSVSDEKVKLVLEKFRVNIKLIKESLKVFEVEAEVNFSPTFSKKGKAQSPASKKGAKKTDLTFTTATKYLSFV